MFVQQLYFFVVTNFLSIFSKQTHVWLHGSTSSYNYDNTRFIECNQFLYSKLRVQDLYYITKTKTFLYSLFLRQYLYMLKTNQEPNL